MATHSLHRTESHKLLNVECDRQTPNLSECDEVTRAGGSTNSDKDKDHQRFGGRAMPLPVFGISEMWCGCSVMRVGGRGDLKRWGDIEQLSFPYCWARF